MEYKIFHFEGIDSTNSWSLSNTHLFSKDMITLVIADKQNHGRGRCKNKWLSPNSGNLYATFGIFVPIEQGVQPNIPQLLALETVKTLKELGLNVKIKWPNDLLINKRKVAGILTETSIDETWIFHAVGIGININMSKKQIDSINKPATSLSIEIQKAISAQQILNKLMPGFSSALECFLKSGFSQFLPHYKIHLIHQENQPVKFHDREQLWEGRFHSLNNDGSLNLMLENGEIKRFLSGNIEENSQQIWNGYHRPIIPSQNLFLKLTKLE